MSLQQNSFGVLNNSDLSQTSFEFDATYNITATSSELDLGVSQVLITG